jgi:hypothetical protein
MQFHYLPFVLCVSLSWLLCSSILQLLVMAATWLIDYLSNRLPVHQRGLLSDSAVLSLKSVTHAFWFIHSARLGTKRFIDVFGVLYIYDYVRFKCFWKTPQRVPTHFFERLFFLWCLPPMLISGVVVCGVLHVRSIFIREDKRTSSARFTRRSFTASLRSSSPGRISFWT